eukprot:scaffold58362_cov18-Prasinocladus_malaysianus.AAC.1
MHGRRNLRHEVQRGDFVPILMCQFRQEIIASEVVARLHRLPRQISAAGIFLKQTVATRDAAPRRVTRASTGTSSQVRVP